MPIEIAFTQSEECLRGDCYLCPTKNPIENAHSLMDNLISGSIQGGCGHKCHLETIDIVQNETT